VLETHKPVFKDNNLLEFIPYFVMHTHCYFFQ